MKGKETGLVISPVGPSGTRCLSLLEARGDYRRLMSYEGPRGEEHYRLYEIPSHPFIPPFVSDPGRDGRNKGECGGMEVEVRERARARDRETEQTEEKRGAGSARLLKQLRPG